MIAQQSTYKLLVTAKHRSMNNVLWRVVAGRTGGDGGPDAARGPPVGQHCGTAESSTHNNNYDLSKNLAKTALRSWRAV